MPWRGKPNEVLFTSALVSEGFCAYRFVKPVIRPKVVGMEPNSPRLLSFRLGSAEGATSARRVPQDGAVKHMVITSEDRLQVPAHSLFAAGSGRARVVARNIRLKCGGVFEGIGWRRRRRRGGWRGWRRRRWRRARAWRKVSCHAFVCKTTAAKRIAWRKSIARDGCRQRERESHRHDGRSCLHNNTPGRRASRRTRVAWLETKGSCHEGRN